MLELSPNKPGNGITEFVGTTVLDTIGLIIPNVDWQLRAQASYLKD